MKHITIVGLQHERKPIIELLHKAGAVQIEDADAAGRGLDRKDNSKSIAKFDAYMSECTKALEIINKYAPESKGLFSSREKTDISNYTLPSQQIEKTLNDCRALSSLAGRIAEHKEDINRIDVKVNALSPYLMLDVPMKCTESKSTVFMAGLLPGEWSGERIAQSLEGIERVSYEVLSGDKLNTAVWIAVHKSEREKLLGWRKETGFSQPQFSLSHRTPKDKVRVLTEAKQKLESEIGGFEEEIKKYDTKREAIEMLYDYLELRRDKYREIQKFAMTKNTFIIEGWISAGECEPLKKRLDSEFTVYIEARAPYDDEEPPVRFKNPALISPVEDITRTYAMPSKHDIDPNPIMAIFYYIFFGMMFSDAGYGLIMVIGCYILGFTNKLEKKKRSFFKMFFWCGVSTAFWGIMYGSFFGDAVDKIAQTFFGLPQTVQLIKPLWINPQKEALLLLIVSIAFGMVQILVGLGIKFHMNWRRGLYSDAVLDVGMWMLVLLGACVLGGGMGFGIGILKNVGAAMMIAGAAGLVLTGGRKKKGIGKVFGGVASLYDITSYVSDALSYSRLMALGLATGVIAQVVNILGTMGGKSVGGVIMFVLIFIIGHAINFGLNVLGAYVHTNRLQYVEFYSKFYEGGGEAFAPFEMETKYHRFTD